MAEKKQHTIVSASTGNVMTEAEKKKAAENAKTPLAAKPTGSATGYRIGAILLWIAGIALEVVAILTILRQEALFTNLEFLTFAIIALVLDLICVVIGSLLWKKANHIKPASEKNKVLFWIYNNLGVIISIIAFLPFIIITLTDKNADKKTKTIATIVAAVALLIGGFSSYEYNPISAEQQAAAMETMAGRSVYWTKGGNVYHTSEDCQAFSNSGELMYGDVEQAIAAKKTRLCKFCAKRDDIDTEGLLTEKGEVSDDEIIEVEYPTVYWADGADYYHKDPNCSALDDFEDLVSGTEDFAADAGKTGECPLCFN